jgi:hypothetical protein
MAMRTPHLKGSPRFDNLKSIYKSIVIATEYTGSIKAEDEKAFTFMTEKFLEEVVVKYPYARHGEIELAFRKGALKEYGDYFGINVQTLWNWFKKYMDSSELLNSKREWINLIEMPKSDKPVIDLKAEMREPILNAYKDFLTTETLPFTAPSFYTLICKIKGVKTVIESKEDRAKIKEEAFSSYKAKLMSEKTHIKNKPQFDKLIEWAINGNNPSYDTEARRVALKYYFNGCKSKGLEPI